MRRPKCADVNEASTSSSPLKTGMMECSSCENLALPSINLDSSFLETSRLDFELHGDVEVCTVSKIHQYPNDGDRHQEKPRPFTRRRKHLGGGNNVNAECSLCTKPNLDDHCENDGEDNPAAHQSIETVPTPNSDSSENVVRTTPVRSSSRYKKIQALLQKLDRPTSVPQRRLKKDDQDGGELGRSGSTTHERQSDQVLEKRQSIQRSKSASATLSRGPLDRPRKGPEQGLPPPVQTSFSHLRKEMQKNQKRVPIRTLRMQQRASIIIQSCCRRFLSRCKVRRLRLLEDYRRYRRPESARNERLEAEKREHEVRLINIQQQTEDEINLMWERLEQEQEILKAQLYEAHALVDGASDSHLDLLEEFVLQIHNELATVQEEHRMLLGEISVLEEMILELEEEHETLTGTNEQIMTMFRVLNDYARNSVMQKEGLEEAARTYNRLEIEKVRQEIRVCSTASSVETATKNVYRNCIYQHIYSSNKVDPPSDAERFAKFLSIVRECEDYLGKPLLNMEEAMALQNDIATSDDLGDDDEDDWDD